MHACRDDVWLLAESACVKSLLERRCLDQLVNCEPSFINVGKVERLDVPARRLLSLAMVVATQSH